MRPILDISDVSVSYGTGPVALLAVRQASISVAPGEVLGIAGESGSGKSTLAMAVLGLLPKSARMTTGTVRLGDTILDTLSPAARRSVLGPRIATVFQNPMASLNPVLTIGQQMLNIQYRDPASAQEKLKRALAALEQVRLSDAVSRLSQYPGSLSGGMRQRVCLAMALLMRPEVLIADEPTTALDATLEREVLDLFDDLRRETGCAIILITHHLGALSYITDRVAVMYAGEIVEILPTAALMNAAHPYTRALVACDPAFRTVGQTAFSTIQGGVPLIQSMPTACIFAPRCDHAVDRCRAERAVSTSHGPSRVVACHFPLGGAKC